jgi:hypothetical protein
MMNASHPITHRWGSLLAATMTTLLLSMIPLVTLAENTDQMILKQQQTSVAAAERKPNTAKISPSYTTNYVGNTNKLPYPQRPSSIIQIDLDYFLHVMENITSAADTMAKSDDDAETFHVPKNPVVNSYPRKRLVSPFSLSLSLSLSLHTGNDASRMTLLRVCYHIHTNSHYVYVFSLVFYILCRYVTVTMVRTYLGR